MKHLVLAVLILGSRLVFGAPAVKCSDLLAISFGSEVKIASATLVAETSATPEHCDVRGTIWPEAGFAVKLPTTWNNRFYMAGNGGTAGTISLAAMDTGLRKGYATASTDTGHSAEKEPLAVFAYSSSTNPNADRKAIDFDYQAVHETAVLGKKIIQAYYGEAPRYSYWVGCSTGGRQGMAEAQRFPEDFDGLVTGAPQIAATGSNMRILWNARAQSASGEITAGKLPLLAKAVYQKCDGIDGLEDGLIDDPRKCNFDPERDLAKCPAGIDGPSCFSAGQIEALKKIYGGVRKSDGTLIFPGQPPGSEIAAQGGRGGPRSGWEGIIAGSHNPSVERSESYMKFMFLDPHPGPSWNYTMFNFDTDPARMADPASNIDQLNPDLTPLKKRGGKILHYHGWADPLINPLESVAYYESVIKKMGEKETQEFYRFYVVPGMFHCSGGPGCGKVDWFAPVVDWVEKGIAPEKLIGSHQEGGKSTRTRPLCPYPQVARYKGTGSIDAAENFTCTPPLSR